MKLGHLVSLALVLAIVMAISGSAFAQQATYVSNKQCKICHNTKEMGEIWNVWKASNHSKALDALSSDAAKAVAQKAGVDKPAESPKCLACHVTAADAASGKQPETLAKEDGVQCESCHGAASLHTADGKKFKSGDKSVNMAAHINAKPDEKVCLTCHNDKNPTYNPNRYTLPDGKKADFDFKQAWEKIKHGIPKKG